MNKPGPILVAVRLALCGSAAATTPALIAAGVGLAHGPAAEAAVRCRHGQEVAACARHPVAGEQELHLHQDEGSLPRERAQPPPPADVPWIFWEDAGSDETHQIAQENLRRQHNLIAPFHER
jgi:hypothetical protein